MPWQFSCFGIQNFDDLCKIKNFTILLRPSVL
jgi:hypothetical protein